VQERSSKRAIPSLLDGATVVAYKAGRAILDIYSKDDLGATVKEDSSPLTLADAASHRIICAGLSKLTPSIPALSEESGPVPWGVRRLWKDYWLVDPLDGTKEFIKRNGEFTVNIALIEGAAPVLGVVLAPALGLCYWAERGKGAFRSKDGQTAKICVAPYAGGKVNIVGSRSHAGAEQDVFVKKIGRVMPSSEPEFKGIGSSLKLCLVADGSAHLYPRFGPTMEWDIAAAQCIVEEAGGAVTDLNGAPLRYNKEDMRNPSFIVTGSPPFPWQQFIQ